MAKNTFPLHDIIELAEQKRAGSIFKQRGVVKSKMERPKAVFWSPNVKFLLSPLNRSKTPLALR